MATVAERLVERLRGQADLASRVAPGTTAQRLGHSPAQRKNGAWSWHLVSPEGRYLDIGSQYTMTECLAAPRLVTGTDPFGSISIYPED